MGVHAGHGVLVGLKLSLAGEDVHLRIVGHHALIHAVEGQALAVGAPEESFTDAELIAVDGLAIDNLSRAISGELPLLAVSGTHVELLVALEGQGATLLRPVLFGLVGVGGLGPLEAFFLKIVERPAILAAQEHQRLVSVGIGGSEGRAEVDVGLQQGEEHVLLAVGVDGAALFHVLIHQLVAPPGKEQALRTQVVVVATAEVEVFQCEKLLG